MKRKIRPVPAFTNYDRVKTITLKRNQHELVQTWGERKIRGSGFDHGAFLLVQR